MNLVSIFQEMTRIFGFCPCCGELFRLSEATLFTKDPPPRTEFDRIADSQRRLERRVEKFEDEEADLREAAARRGQASALRRLRRIVPEFSARKINPMDVKVLFHPIDYVVFRGLSQGEARDIAFVDRPPSSTLHERVQRSINRVIKAGNIEWQTLRIDQDGKVVRDHR
jgi:predicted Holliday junction resolvase-like endonuclease